MLKEASPAVEVVPWYRRPATLKWARRVGVFLVSVGTMLSCPYWPVDWQGHCRAIVKFILSFL